MIMSTIFSNSVWIASNCTLYSVRTRDKGLYRWAADLVSILGPESNICTPQQDSSQQGADHRIKINIEGKANCRRCFPGAEWPPTASINIVRYYCEKQFSQQQIFCWNACAGSDPKVGSGTQK